MPIKIEESIRVAIFIGPEYRDMLNEVADFNHRGQRDQIEFIIKKEYQKMQDLLTKEK